MLATPTISWKDPNDVGKVACFEKILAITVASNWRHNKRRLEFPENH